MGAIQPGAKTGRPGQQRNKRHKEALRAAYLLNRLDKAAKGEIEMTSEQIRAAEIVLRKSVPDLAAIQQTNINEDDLKPAEQIMSELVLMLKSSPDLLLTLVQAVRPELAHVFITPQTDVHIH